MTEAVVTLPTALTHVGAREQCLATLSAGSKSFAFASKLLPPPVRSDAAVVYAWCRHADDSVDLVDRAAQPAAVSDLRARLAFVYSGRSQRDTTLEAFQQVVFERRIPIEYPSELLSGMAMDAEGAHYETLGDLLHYCYRVAGTVGLMMCHVLGVKDERALVHAAHLGMAMQLTNVCRDVIEDWERGRLYLPQELLEKHGAHALHLRLGDPFAMEHRVAVSRATAELLAVAERYYRSGDAGFSSLDFRSALSIRAARLVYCEIGRRVARRGHDPIAPRAVVPTSHKLALAARALFSAALELPQRWAEPAAPAVPTTIARYPDDIPSL